MSISSEETARCRLYLVTPPVLPDLGAFADQFKAALNGGDVACLQLRLKSGDDGQPNDEDVLRAADILLPIAKTAGVAFLINDDPKLAKQSGADGVHVGQTDMACRQARALLGDEASIGVTCHNSIDLAFRAGEDGADYVAFGAFFSTETKQAATRATPEILSQWHGATVIPSVAIGGISPENGGRLVRAGADFLAVSAAVWDDPDGPDHAVAAFQKTITEALAG